MGFLGNAVVVAVTVLSTEMNMVNGDGSGWSDAHATFYGGSDASGTMGGGCVGMEICIARDMARNTAALSTALFNNGNSCGACFKIKCVKDDQWYLSGSIIVIGTNSFRPNLALSNDNGGWCNPPLSHFDLAQPVFQRIAQYKAGIVPVQYIRLKKNEFQRR